ncbi:hypothetical protein SAMN03159341_1465 [Paenibacillus sp. 1_12]|uniref:hypothetical protein n=1 Tax=Paenibacillus sp. 1_12 TaxID=1566278 RepID=UPI0008E0CBE3|nr:hypothetical protein [Paenibacillus sp. 1_12]SFM54314.1 hypothetical protein SAMN03159341_1465 [Paenibacillus sp. 1_12]
MLRVMFGDDDILSVNRPTIRTASNRRKHPEHHAAANCGFTQPSLRILNPFPSKGLSRFWGQRFDSVGSKIATVLTAAICDAPVAIVAFLGAI